MKKIIFMFLLLVTFSASAQQDILKMDVSQEVFKKRLDSAMRSVYFITVSDAEKILGKQSHLKDSTYKYVNGLLRYTFDYVANKIDSTSKGRIFFDFEQYKDDSFSKDIYKNLKTENEKNGGIVAVNDIGDEGFLQKDNLGQPFIIIRKNNKIYKLRVYYVTSATSLDEAMNVAKKIVAAH
ncbi:MAG: hypothetical protein ACXVPU_19870 [Bacteroidia bacterium]